VVLVRGGNGSGKTSLLRAIAGLSSHRPPGEVELMGSDPSEAPARTLPWHVRYVPEVPREALVGLTVAGEFRLRSMPVPPEWQTRATREATHLSQGEARRLALSIQGAHVLLLDEPCPELDEEARAELRGRIQAQEGIVVMVDHTGTLHDLANRVLDFGEPAAGPLPPMPAPGEEPVLYASAGWIGEIPLPEVVWGTGFHVVTGPNGSGKSSLLARVAGLGGPRAEAGARRLQVGDVAFLQQDGHDLLLAERVGDELPAHPEAGLAELLGALVPPAWRDRHPRSLSRGEAQRVAIAKALGRPAVAYLLDEPEAHLDGAARKALVDLIAYRAAAAPVVAATHDAGLGALAATDTHCGGAP
jgi:energy-coupling factor transporter ATP-binding protein EcfA2